MGNPGLPHNQNVGVITHPNNVFGRIGTVFNDEAPRNIRDVSANTAPPGNNIPPYTAHYRPEADGALRALRGRTAASLTADHRLPQRRHPAVQPRVPPPAGLLPAQLLVPD
jgi:hypothetical protein